MSYNIFKGNFCHFVEKTSENIRLLAFAVTKLLKKTFLCKKSYKNSDVSVSLLFRLTENPGYYKEHLLYTTRIAPFGYRVGTGKRIKKRGYNKN